MKYVIDSSVTVKWVLPEPDSDKALFGKKDRFRDAEGDGKRNRPAL